MADVEEKKQQSSILKIAKQVVAPGAAFNLLINILFGSGPIYLPGEYLAAGWLLSTIFTSLVAVVSWICAEFVIESMSNINALVYLDQQALRDSIQEDVSQEEGLQKDLLDDTTQDEYDQPVNENPFVLRKVMEFGQMSKYLWGKAGDIATTIILTIYLIGVLISKTIASSNILGDMFEYIGVGVLDSYYFWLSLFCVCAIAFSFSDIGGVKMLQVITVAIRFTVIGLMIIGPIYMIADGQGGGLTPIDPRTDNPGFGKPIPPFNMPGFEGFFSTAIFALLCHHSIPSILTNVEPTNKIRTITYISFILGAVLFITISLTGIAAFQGQMVQPQLISIYSENFQGHIDWIYYIISFYMFLNVAAFPVIIITCRNNIMKCFFPHKLPKQSWKMTPHTAIITVCLIIPIVLISIVAKEKAETVISVIGGVFGVFLMILIPSALVIFTRIQLIKKNANLKDNQYLCIIPFKFLPHIFQVIGWACLIYNLYSDIQEWTS